MSLCKIFFDPTVLYRQLSDNSIFNCKRCWRLIRWPWELVLNYPFIYRDGWVLFAFGRRWLTHSIVLLRVLSWILEDLCTQVMIPSLHILSLSFLIFNGFYNPHYCNGLTNKVLKTSLELIEQYFVVLRLFWCITLCVHLIWKVLHLHSTVIRLISKYDLSWVASTTQNMPFCCMILPESVLAWRNKLVR